MLRIYLNGKFTAQRTTGVQRVAANLVKALDADPSIEAGRCVLICPPGGVAPELHRIEVRHVGARGLPLHVWEQVVLPLVSAKGLLVNLAGAAPYLARHQLCLIHDAAVFDHPKAYRPAFRAWYRLLFRHLARSAAILVTVSDDARGRLAACLGVPVGRIAVVRNGADHLNGLVADDDVLARHGLVGARYLLAVGSANPTKNLAALVEAFARLPTDPARRLVIVGGSHRQVFAGSDGGAGPAGVARLEGVDDAALKSLYRHATGLVFPSFYEGSGLPPLEAMACGCPVAAARAAAIPEVCGKAALYFDPCDADAIAAAMQRLWTEAPLRATLRDAGRSQAQGARWADSAAALWALLERADLRRAAVAA